MRTALYVSQLRQRVSALLGTHCAFCGATEKLEFAHIHDTGLSGHGRGRVNRLLNVIKYPESYCLLCDHCHTAFDSRHRPEQYLYVYYDKKDVAPEARHYGYCEAQAF